MMMYGQPWKLEIFFAVVEGSFELNGSAFCGKLIMKGPHFMLSMCDCNLAFK